MKPQIIASTCALIISAYGITPAVAESFNDRGLDWTMDSPMPTTAYASNPQMLPRDGSFASSWGGGNSAYGITPAVAESFNDRGLDWTMDSPMPTTAYASNPQMLPRDGSFASSWGDGNTPTQYEDPSSSSAHLATGQSCDPTPRVGFSQKNNFATC